MKRGVLAVGMAILVAVSLAAGYGATSSATRTSTEMLTSTTTQTTISTTVSTLTTTMKQTMDATTSQVTRSPCEIVEDGVLPFPPAQQVVSPYYFLVNVDYDGQWGANASPGWCYSGDGDEFFIMPFSANSTMRFVVTKLDGSYGDLVVTLNSMTNSTSAPYGSVVLAATPYRY